MHRTAELRWFHKEEAPEAYRQWFKNESPRQRTDHYYRRSGERLGIKLRDGKLLEHKPVTSREELHLLLRTIAGNIQTFEKWSFPVAEGAEGYISDALSQPDTWQAVHKTRRIQQYALQPDGSIQRHTGDGRPAEGCEIELALIKIEEDEWYSIGMEAYSDKDREEFVLRQVATWLFTEQGFPTECGGIDASKGYANWLYEEYTRLW